MRLDQIGCDYTFRIYKARLQKILRPTIVKSNHVQSADTERLVLHCGSQSPHNSGMSKSRGQKHFLASGILALLGSLGGLWPGSSLASSLNYSIRTWQTEDGLPQNSITAIVEGNDGYLWLGTYSGLVRFDGVRFTIFERGNTPSLKNGRITSLFEDNQGTLWIGHETGDLTRMRSGVFESVDLRGSWVGGPIAHIAADKEDIWLMNRAGILERVRDHRILPLDAGATGEGHLATMLQDGQGKLWVLRQGELSVQANGQLAPPPFVQPPAKAMVNCIGSSPDGGVWITSEGRLREWKDGGWSRELPIPPNFANSAYPLAGTKGGAVAMGSSDRGVSLLAPDGTMQHFTRTNGLASDWITRLLTDRNDNIWVGSGNGGLAIVHQVNFAQVNPPDNWEGMALRSVSAGRDGSIWVGTEGAGLYRLQHGDWTRMWDNVGLSSKFVWTVLEDSKQRLWVGTWGTGLFTEHEGRFQSVPGFEGRNLTLAALLEGRHGELWIGTGDGLLRYENGKTVSFGHKQGLKVPDVRAIMEDNRGAIWFGMFGGGLGCLKDDAVKLYGESDGLASDFVVCLAPDEGGGLWVGTLGGGLNRLKNGRFSKITAQNGLPSDAISYIQDDGCGNFWLGTQAGIVEASKSALNQCADGLMTTPRCMTFGTGDGLETTDCPGGFQPAGCQTPDGRLWLPTRKGLVAVDPANLRTNLLPPPVMIEEIFIDGQRAGNSGGTPPSLRLEAGSYPLRVPPGRHRLDIHYTALDFGAPEKVRFKYRLAGLEPEWMDAGNTRNVTYNFVPPGDYQFKVIACNNDGVWNEAGASVDMVVLRYYWQTWWFATLAYTAAAASVAWAVLLVARRRHRRKMEQLERHRALERERTRIAQDIHDDLGASLTRITMLTQTAPKDLTEPAQVAERLDDIYQTARDLTRTMDEIVWAINPKYDIFDSVATYFVRFAQQFLSPAGIRCRWEVPERLPPWPVTAEVRHNLFLAFKESLHNVVRHADASEVRISFNLEPSSFIVSIEDNGKGFPAGPAATSAMVDEGRLAGGNGLNNMCRRMEEIGGSCVIAATPGHGTRVSFVVIVKPVAAAEPGTRRNFIVRIDD